MSGGARLAAATPAAVAAAAELLCRGELVAFPTETVYGLGADARDDRAVAAVFEAKARPRFNPLIIHVPELAAAEDLVLIDDRCRALAAEFWPGPLTLVLPRRLRCGVSLLASAGLETLAVRVPGHTVAQALLAACGRPIAAPSANQSGAVSPTTAAHVAEGLGAHVAMILDAGPCRIGLESTVIDMTRPRPVLLRPGGVPAEDLQAAMGPLDGCGQVDGSRSEHDSGRRPLRSPGLLTRHYAPGKPLRMEAREARPGEAVLGFGPDPDHRATLNLSPTGELREAAANLFAMLHKLDRGAWTGIAVTPIPDVGLGQAINDRLRRAATASGPGDGSGPRSLDDDWDRRGPSGPCVLPDMDEPD